MESMETDRLRLRLLKDSDLDDLARIQADPDVMRYMGLTRTREETLADIKKFIDHFDRHRFTMWAVETRKDGRLIGRAGLWFLDGTDEIEIAYLLEKPQWGRGLATETARACVRFGFEQLELDSIVGICEPSNSASRRVLEKVGFVYLREDNFYKKDVLYHLLDRDTWMGTMTSSTDGA